MPGALTWFAYRDVLLPRTAFRHAWEALSVAGTTREPRPWWAYVSWRRGSPRHCDRRRARSRRTARLYCDVAKTCSGSNDVPRVAVILPSLASYDRLIISAGMEPTLGLNDHLRLPCHQLAPRCGWRQVKPRGSVKLYPLCSIPGWRARGSRLSTY